MDFPIFLMGLMGSGKTHWGKMLAEKLKVDFFDLDETIKQGEGMSIVEIFEKFGEYAFRELEVKYLKELVKREKAVIALGGGTPCFYNNMNQIKNQGTSFYLKCDVAFIVDRLQQENLKRPLIKGKNKEELLAYFEQQLKQREPYYLKAKYVVDAENLTEGNLLKVFVGEG